MNLSKYCFSYKDSFQPTLFQTLTREDIVIDEELFDVLKRRAFHELDENLRAELVDSGVLLNDNLEEERLLAALFPPDYEFNQTLEVTYAVTYSCNMSCSYCVQSPLQTEKECSEDKVISGLLNILNKKNPKNFRLSFFGGEPLLERNKIYNISSAMHAECEKKGIDIELAITTNGTLLRTIDTSRLYAFGLRDIDVTLDGDSKTHDARRMYHDGKGSFYDIVEGFRGVHPGVSLNIICNISGGGTDYSPFIHFLSDSRNDFRFESVRFKPFFNDAVNEACFFSGEHVDVLKSIWREADRHSLPVDKSFIIGPCGFFSKNAIAVSPGGQVYPCTPFYGDDRHLLGNIGNALALEKRHKLKDNLPRRCLECVYVTICGGGCRFVSSRLQDDVAQATCEKKFFDSIFSPL